MTEIDRIGQRISLAKDEIEKLKRRKLMDCDYIPSRVFTKVPQAKQELSLVCCPLSLYYQDYRSSRSY